MRLAIKMAYRNLIGAGLRTWLNVIVLSFSFVIIIWMKGIISGWDHQAKTDMKNWAIGDGQYWHEMYDPYDPLTLNDAHAPIPVEFMKELAEGTMEPMLVVQGTIYPQGRMQSVLVKGINPKQTLLKLPTQKFDTLTSAVPALIGVAMAKSSQLKTGDFVTLRWRDIHGTFDATEILIVTVFLSNVPAAEASQVYIPLDRLQSMTALPGEATLLTFSDVNIERPQIKGWTLKSFPELTKQIDEVIKAKTIGQSVFYFVLLLLAMLAIFDTQVLSIFRRQKEIGTYIALGYTRQQVVGLFTVEGTMHAILAALLSAAYGIPFLMWQAKVGWTMPMDTSQFGMAIAKTLYPVYSAGLIIGTTLLVTVTTAVVSYWPSRRIAKMNPTEALRGKLQ
jgi:ABC-type lipoprotein release transport system permease subunit